VDEFSHCFAPPYDFLVFVDVQTTANMDPCINNSSSLDKEIVTVTLFGYMSLISKDFYDFISLFLLSFCFDQADMSNKKDRV